MLIGLNAPKKTYMSGAVEFEQGVMAVVLISRSGLDGLELAGWSRTRVRFTECINCCLKYAIITSHRA